MPSTQFNDNLNIIGESSLEIQLLDGDLAIIQKLDDEPNDVGGLSAQELKAKFDEGGLAIQKYINETLIPAVLAEDAVEAAREAAEAQREANEQQRVADENVRLEAESGRTANEQTRSASEAVRVANESARVATEAQRATNEVERNSAEAIRKANEEQRQNVELGYIAQAEAAAVRAERAAAEAGSIAGGDFATKTQARQYATDAEANANRYTDEKVAAIPTPDVSKQINEHNTNSEAHADIRATASAAQTAANNAQTAANNAAAAVASKAPMYDYGTTDLEAGVTALETGKLYFVYE